MVAALLALLLAACGDDTPTYRYRLTVEVNTPAGLRTGSSVIEVSTRRVRLGMDPGSNGLDWKTRGEAVAVDMPDGRTLFALLRSENDIDWSSRVMFMLAPNYRGEGATEHRYDALVRDRYLKTLPRMWPRTGHLDRRSAYPMLVTFGDVDDPTSVALVDPDELAASFGDGVTLRRITVQITDDPVSTGIQKLLGWIGQTREMNLKQEDFPADLPLGDFSGLFKKGFDGQSAES